MKKLILTALALTSTLGVFAQGTVIFNNRVTGTLVTHVYLPNGNTIRAGNGAGDTAGTNAPGSTDWAGFTLVGNTLANAQNTKTVILSAPGANAAASSLVASLPITTFRTGTAAGQFAPATSTLANVAADAPVATLAIAVWDNSSGLYATWAQASVAWQNGLIAAGISPLWNQDLIGGVINGAPNLINSTDSSQHLSSFNIYLVSEPGTFALAGLGAAAMLIFRRRK